VNPPARAVPAWAAASAALAPVALIGGWTIAAARQVGHFNPVRESISALAARGATDRWIMTVGLAVLGACHVVTALGLRPARVSGRWLLAAGGVSTLVVGASPQPAHGSAPAHLLAASVGFATLTLWPVFAACADGPVVLRRRYAAVVTGVLLALLGWLAVEIGADGAHIGLSERMLAGAQAAWPLIVVVTVRAGWGQAARMAW
jgi:hypothetical membrane protein